jgi:hypothetical protein
MTPPIIQKTWAELSARLGRNDMPGVLGRAIINHTISGRELIKGIAASWISAEWPARQIEPDAWSIIFRMAVKDGHFITDDGEILPHDGLDEELTLYRGAWSDFAEGMSWTDNPQTASWFAHRFDMAGTVGQVYTVTIPRDMVLGRFDGRGEHEYVIDASDLCDYGFRVVESDMSDSLSN